MGYAYQVASDLTLLNRHKAVIAEFNYEAFNAKLNAAFDKEERFKARTHLELLDQRHKREIKLREYKELKIIYLQTAGDRRLKPSTRKQRLNDIIEAMLNIEDYLCI